MDKEEMTPSIFVELINEFYHLNWMMGSGGGMAAICSSSHQVLYSPSSIQKERIKETDLFVLDATDGTLLKRPLNEKIKESACTPVFNLFINLTDAQCVIHTHSKCANLLTQLIRGKYFEISDQEMIKGVLNRQTDQAYSNFDRLIVPIIENAPQEYMLLPALKDVLRDFPNTCGVLVRNHGFFCWATSWQRAKIMLECYEYLFELACEMIQNGLPLVKSITI